MRLKVPEILQRLVETASMHADADKLLRVYWYDAPPNPGSLQGEQLVLANMDNVKLRLGFLNSSGQQKGVDSLIVTDLIELARRKAMTDALLLSGDEDVRVGVQFAQQYGVRVTLLGIHPARGSQSRLLRQEADVCLEWLREDLEEILEIGDVAPVRTAGGEAALPESIVSILEEMLMHESDEDLRRMHQYQEKTGQLEAGFDAKLLGLCRQELGRMLTEREKRELRKQVIMGIAEFLEKGRADT